MSVATQPESTVEQYHRDYSRLSKTMLNHFASSRQKFYHYYVAQDHAPPKPTSQMIVGTAVHKILLERIPVENAVTVYDDTCFKVNGHLNPKPAAKFREENASKLIVKQSELDTINATCNAVKDHELGKLISNQDAEFETVITWTDRETGMECRAMVDFFIDMGDHIRAYDLKTTDQVEPMPFKRTAKRFRYWLQDAHYSNGLEANFSKPVSFGFWCVETDFPHRLCLREYTPHSREMAASHRLRYMTDLQNCHETGDWRDEFTKEKDMMTLEPWDEDMPVQELEGFDDDEE